MRAWLSAGEIGEKTKELHVPMTMKSKVTPLLGGLLIASKSEQ